MAAHSHYLKLYIFNLIICFKTAGIEILSLQLTSVIETNKGPVRGEILTSADRKIKFSSFRGIRYGKPPIGNLRFKVINILFYFINNPKIHYCGKKK